MTSKIIKESHPPDEPIFDESVSAFNSDGGIELNADLIPDQIEDAVFWNRFRTGQEASVMLITGEGGSGKGVLLDMICWKFKRYYPNCKAILDFIPRRPFGHYHLFDTSFVVNQVDKMAAIAKGECSNPKAFEEKSRAWLASDGQVFFKNSVVGLDEIRKYHNKRRCGHPMGILLTDFYTIGRHLDTLLIGATVKENELDNKAYLPHVKYHVKMRKDLNNEYVFIASINWVQWDKMDERFFVLGKYAFPINGAAPHPEIGLKPDDEYLRRQTFDPKSDYYCWFDLFNSKNAQSLNIPKSMRKEQ